MRTARPELGLGDYSLYSLGATLELALAVGNPDPAGFNEPLRHALIRHRRFWHGLKQNPGEFDRQRIDSKNFIALGPLCHCCLRYDFGLPIGICSDCLPRNVIGPRWDGS